MNKNKRRKLLTNIYGNNHIHCGECMITLSLTRSGACNLAILVPLCSPRGCCVVLAVSECNTAKCSFSAVCPPWEAFDQLRCCVCFQSFIARLFSSMI